MRNTCINIILIILTLVVTSCLRQEKHLPVCRVENNQVIFRIDRRWDDKARKEFADLYDLDSTVIAQASKGNNEFVVKGVTWKTRIVDVHFIDLSKPIETISDSLFAEGYVFMVTGGAGAFGGAPGMPDNYGVNAFFRENTFRYRDGKTTFRLPGHSDAGNVILSGTFNNWSTSEAVMAPSDSGWTVTMKLTPGKYAYKYIVDGEWMPDPVNSLTEDDLNGGENSVIYCYNYCFRVKGMTDLPELRLTGDFMTWDPAGIGMKRVSDGWELPIYLKEGIYYYKFVSGTRWFTDPGNTDIIDDGQGNINSVLSIGEKYTFRLEGYTNASGVILAGTFNGWRPDQLKMIRTQAGWFFSLPLAPGNYEYKFIVDGRWMPDPANENTTGTGDYTNSVMCFKPNHVFTLNGYENAREVMVSGSFNNFSYPGYRMSKKDGKWVLPVYLKPGKTIYKFIVDGAWILDPDNDLWEDNEYGTGNSVLWVE